MSGGLFALLDDVAALVKMSAATLDDIPAQVAKTSTKVSGVVIDDAAVTPKYVVGLDPSRELHIIYKIARKSLFNKLIILAPSALILGFLAPWAITPILMLGGAYLCFEGYEKVHSIFAHHEDTNHDGIEDGPYEEITPEQLEEERIDGAVTTDMILSAEIIAITYGTVADKDIIHQIMVLISVAIFITVAVYGFVGLLVKADDIGVHFAKDKYPTPIRAFGRFLVKIMVPFLTILGYIGTVAMLWVGAEIMIHGIPPVHHALESLLESLSFSTLLAISTKILLCATAGLMIGAVVVQTIKPAQWILRKIKKN